MADDNQQNDDAPFACSCVVEDTPAIWASFAPWLVTAIELARVPPSQIHVHHVCALRPEMARLCQTLGVATHAIEPFDPRFPHTNKIQQCATDFGGVRHVLLTDVDIAFARQPPLTEIRAPVAGKLVDRPNPPVEILYNVFAAAGVTAPPPCTGEHANWRGARITFPTLPGNFNGGLYIIEPGHLARLGPAWSRWARWLIARIELLDRWAVHVDQVAFCLAANELQTPLAQLDDAWNLPPHLPLPAVGSDPILLHHHGSLDRRQRLRRHPTLRAREAISRVNRTIETHRLTS